MEYLYKQVGRRAYPIVPLIIGNENASLSTDALIDSGSLLSLFRMEIAQQLGIAYKSGKPARVASVHGELLVYVHTLTINLAGKKFPCAVGFSDAFTPNLNLLGRLDFFERFLITFNDPAKKVILQPF